MVVTTSWIVELFTEVDDVGTGLVAWASETEVRATQGGSDSGDDSDMDMMFGVGVEWPFYELWSLTLDLERSKLNARLDVPSISVRITFRQAPVGRPAWADSSFPMFQKFPAGAYLVGVKDRRPD